MNVSSNFDGGNISVLSSDNSNAIRLEIIPDNQSEFFQWFYFRLTGARGVSCRIYIVNAGQATYPDGFRNYRVVYSYDRQTWLRHPTEFRDGILSIDFLAEHDSVYFSYFAPYSMERHHDLIARAACSGLTSLTRLGTTLDGQDLDLLTIQDPASVTPGRPLKNCWFMARQHPGETMAEWWMEGLLDCLLNPDDPLAGSLLEQCRFYVVPNMNPDGSRRGHLRCNAAGRNLNREWQNPSMEYSPEVYLVKQKMSETGVDFFMDIHGDESLPYCFIAGTEGLADWNEDDQQALDFFKNTLAGLNRDFQTEQGYGRKNPGEANMGMSTSQTASLHGCLAMTLEMPFKDTTATPDSEFGWSPERSRKLAYSCLQTLQAFLDRPSLNSPWGTSD
jgi:murein tripeptide amidase MpaA